MNNTSDIFSFLCEQMKKLSDKEISTDEAKAQAHLAKQVNNVLKYELDRANTLIKLVAYPEIQLREIENNL